MQSIQVANGLSRKKVEILKIRKLSIFSCKSSCFCNRNMSSRLYVLSIIFTRYGSEYHAFWDVVYDDKANYVRFVNFNCLGNVWDLMVLISFYDLLKNNSAFTNEFTPIGVEFMRWASPDWVSESVSVKDSIYGDEGDDDSVQRTGSPWGLLVPIMNPEGQGYFRCFKINEETNMNVTDRTNNCLGNNPVFDSYDDCFST